MLGTHERTLLLEKLRPPTGYCLRRAVGTSYSLDLNALMTAPLALTFLNGRVNQEDHLALFEALRRTADKITVFCQAGGLNVPDPRQPLLAYLENSVYEIRAPNGGVFHPKVWVLNYESTDGPAIYRVLCLSRNLTFARAWDTCLCLDGTLNYGRKNDYSRNEPLAELLLALPTNAVRPIPEALKQALNRMANEVKRVEFQLPKPFTDFHVHNFGLRNKEVWPFPKSKRSLVVSPFLSEPTIRVLVRDHGLEYLISRVEALDELAKEHGREALPEQCYVLSDGANLDSRNTGRENSPADIPASVVDREELVGLHAKMFLFEIGHESRLFTGSANATHAAFHHNVEVLIELVGNKKTSGIKALLPDDSGSRNESLRFLLDEYCTPKTDCASIESLGTSQKRAEELARAIGATQLTATIHPTIVENSWDISLTFNDPYFETDLTAHAKIKVWPVTLREDLARTIAGPLGTSDPVCTFEGLTFDALTAFFAFEVSIREGHQAAKKRFAVTAELLGTPKNREQRLITSILKNRRTALEFLFLILVEEGADVMALNHIVGDGDKSPGNLIGGWNSESLLEALLRCLSTNPKQIDRAACTIETLKESSDGERILPEGLKEIWEPVWAARKATRS